MVRIKYQEAAGLEVKRGRPPARTSAAWPAAPVPVPALFKRAAPGYNGTLPEPIFPSVRPTKFPCVWGDVGEKARGITTPLRVTQKNHRTKILGERTTTFSPKGLQGHRFPGTLWPALLCLGLTESGLIVSLPL